MVSMRNKIGMLDITFTSADFKGRDPMVISIEVIDYLVRKALVDQGNSANILFFNTFKQLDIPESTLQPRNDSLFRFASESVSTRGSIKLFTRFDTKKNAYKDVIVKYVVIHTSTFNKILLGRPSINVIGAIVSTMHLTMKFI